MFSLILDCRNINALGIPEEALFDDWNYESGQALGRAVVERGAEAMLVLVPSATRLGDNLIVFTANLRPDARLAIVQFHPLKHLRKRAR